MDGDNMFQINKIRDRMQSLNYHEIMKKTITEKYIPKTKDK